MIEVIKHGKKKFRAVCSNCGCEFTYELCDIQALGGVDCPDCGHYVAHQNLGNNNGSLYYPPNCRGIQDMPLAEQATKTCTLNFDNTDVRTRFNSITQ